ncbi:MAG: hypothetical protein QNJ55_31515 [Xenococcus sp. MO_188.B8]|nr:hypothetical protein [Xenococcus sp. MO_188.B8]
METPVEYLVEKSLYPKPNPQEKILNSPYFKVAATFAQAALVGEIVEPSEIAEHAINLTDQLIQKVGEKLETNSTKHS